MASRSIGAPGRRLRRWLYLGHRWLGIATGLLFAAWFVSGLVMMYVGYPQLDAAEREAALPPIAWDRVALEPQAAVEQAGGAVRGLDLAMLDREPVYRITPWDGPGRTVSAVDGRAIAPVSADQALAAARHHPAARAPRALGLVVHDQWIVHQRFDPLRPFHRIALGDAAGTELYVSARTGEIAQDTSRHERFWNWFGAVPHWIYVTPLRAQVDLWRDVVLWLSGVAVMGAATGLIVGAMRLRLRRRYPSGAPTPYRGWLAWHHLGGLVAGTTLLTFIASGWISMNPNHWFSPRAPDRAALARYAGAAAPWPPLDRAALAQACPTARAARFGHLDGRPQIQLACAQGPVACCTPADAPSPERIAAAAARLVPDMPPPAIERLTAHDLYWYGHHQARALPVLRVRLADPAGTWFHIDPATGEILDRMDRSNRIQRWLFNAPHSFDFALLFGHRPAWDLVLIALLAGGLLISVSGLVIGWRRLRAKLRRPRRSARLRPQPRG